MKRYKYQATVTLAPRPAGNDTALPGPACRMVVRASHRETHANQLFSALVSSSDTPAYAAAATASQVVVTLVVLGDTAADYLAPGEEFDLLRGRNVGHGVITRRIFV
ncbi:MAG TPA: hypothetical protein VGI74_05735 [Streptosporangiaceae bacterium]